MDYKTIRKTRHDKNLTQVEVARTVGVSLNAYVKWEQGVGSPSEENLQKLKEVLGVKGKE